MERAIRIKDFPTARCKHRLIRIEYLADLGDTAVGLSGRRLGRVPLA
jgi:hypothetical protein